MKQQILQAAEIWAKKVVQDRGQPHWHDLRDSFIVGASMAAKLEREVYKQAFLGNELLKPAGPAPIKGQFSWKCITGEIDAQKNVWFGLVKVMRDPQMWANKWLSQILHILNTTAKGGIIAELDAFEDMTEAEQGYARPDTITWATKGAISDQKIMAKPGAGLISFSFSENKRSIFL